MQAIIEEKLNEIEKEQQVKILYACESGSRGWGFPSPDSDYDVRFVYVRSLNNYLTIRPKDDFMNFPLNDELDINGWDISKVLQLISKSNTTPFEWLQSPIIYKEEAGFREQLWSLCQHYFCPRSNAHHYLGIARGAAQTIDGDKVKIKKLFYILRPLLSALWCLEKGSIAPMTIEPLMELLPEPLQKKVADLIKQKASAEERFEITIDATLKEWIKEKDTYCIQKSNELERRLFDYKAADDFFRSTIKQYSDC